MATTHVFIVDSITFKYHLEYMFAGTGAKDNVIDFNNSSSCSLHYTQENNLVGMISDSLRVRKDDFVIFYLQQNSSERIREGMFYGVFKVVEQSFLDNNNTKQYLKFSLQKSLTFRTLIEPYQVYSKGVTEWEALDEIKNISSPNQMLWSLIYRKLKGNRGNTMITIYESERLLKLIRDKNGQQSLNGNNFSFNKITQEIETSKAINQYKGRKEKINILPRLIEKYSTNKQFEIHLQAYIVQNIEVLSFIKDEKIEWIANEVSCGVGMQRIDIMLSVENKNRKLIPIELKSTYADIGITNQLQRYIDWIKQYYISNRPSDIEPMIISREIENKRSQRRYHQCQVFQMG
jgi:predicted RNA-binding protein